MRINTNFTPKHDEDTLCNSCVAARRIEGTKLTDRYITCSAYDPERRINFKVTKCSSYFDVKVQSKHVLNQISWIQIRKKDGSITFVDGQKYRELKSKGEVY